MTGPDPDQLPDRLTGALRTGLGDGSVDAAALLSGTRRRARLVRQRRAAGIAAAAALVLAVPVGYELVTPHPASDTPPAALLPSASHAPAPGSSAPGSGPTPRATPDLTPDSLALTAAELPPGLERTLDISTPDVPPVPGQQCPAAASAASAAGAASGAAAGGGRPVAGRQWTWVAGGSTAGDSTALTVNLVVTRWPAGAGEPAFASVVADTGACRWAGPQTPHPFTAAGADQSWSGTSQFSTLHYGRAVVRVGDLLAGVEVQDPAGDTAALTTAQRLATTTATRLSHPR